MKYKPGDKVKITTVVKNAACGWSSDMNREIGKITTIKGVYPKVPSYTLNEIMYAWSEEALELVETAKQEVPEYVLCINWGGFSHKKGKVYNVINEYIQCEPEGIPSYYENNKLHFVNSTKAAFDTQNQSKTKEPEVFPFVKGKYYNWIDGNWEYWFEFDRIENGQIYSIGYRCYYMQKERTRWNNIDPKTSLTSANSKYVFREVTESEAKNLPMEEPKKQETEQFRVGDEVECISISKLTSDSTNYMKEENFQIGHKYIVQSLFDYCEEKAIKLNGSAYSHPLSAFKLISKGNRKVDSPKIDLSKTLAVKINSREEIEALKKHFGSVQKCGRDRFGGSIGQQYYFIQYSDKDYNIVEDSCGYTLVTLQDLGIYGYDSKGSVSSVVYNDKPLNVPKSDIAYINGADEEISFNMPYKTDTKPEEKWAVDGWIKCLTDYRFCKKDEYYQVVKNDGSWVHVTNGKDKCILNKDDNHLILREATWCGMEKPVGDGLYTQIKSKPFEIIDYTNSSHLKQWSDYMDSYMNAEWLSTDIQIKPQTKPTIQQKFNEKEFLSKPFNQLLVLEKPKQLTKQTIKF